MKWIVEIRQQFSVFVLCKDIDKGASIKTAIAQDGYDTYLFQDAEQLYNRIKESPPHVVVLQDGSVTVPFDEFIQAILDLNSEIRFLQIGPLTQVQNFLKYRPFNFAPPVIDGEGLQSRVTWAVDEICQAIYLGYQNEQIFQHAENAKQESQVAKQEMKLLQRRTDAGSGVVVQSEVGKYQGATSKEDVLSSFFREINQKYLARNKKVSAIFFKYLPSVQSFVAMQALGLDIETLKGVGGKLTADESKDPGAFFKKGGVPEALRVLLAEGLQAPQAILRSIFVHSSGQSHLDGYLAIWSPSSEVFWEEIENDFVVFNLLYERSHLIRQITAADLADGVTELFGRKHYFKHLADEVARARRLQRAVTVIKMAVDHLPELEQMMGAGGKDQILRVVATVIQKTSRVNDISCRTGENEFSLILPHAARKGASLRAERLRRMMEVQSAKLLGTRFSVSCGVSEYPSHCSSAEELEKSAAQALDYISSKGGNKVCLYQPAETFRPDFDVPAL